jgi:segregation and condensation protein B
MSNSEYESAYNPDFDPEFDPEFDSEANELPLEEVSEFVDHASELAEEQEEEFSLDTLSQVYAQLKKNNSANAEQGIAQPEAASNESSDQPTVPEGNGEDRDQAELTQSTIPLAHKLDSSHEKTSTAYRPGPGLAAMDDDAPCPLTPESIVEAMLFVGSPVDVKLTAKKIAGVLRDVSPKEVSTIVKELNARYEADGSVYRIRSEGGRLSMVLAPTMLPFQQAIFGKSRSIRLPPAAIEVLAVVAYHQPVSKGRVENLRKKPSGQLLLQLTRRGLLELVQGTESQQAGGERSIDQSHRSGETSGTRPGGGTGSANPANRPERSEEAGQPTDLNLETGIDSESDLSGEQQAMQRKSIAIKEGSEPSRARGERSGRRRLFVTTEKFLDLMGLDSIQDLPQSHEIDDIDQILG